MTTHKKEVMKSVSLIEEGRKTVSGTEERKRVSGVEVGRRSVENRADMVMINIGEVADLLQVRVIVTDMPGFMQVHAFRCARQTFDSLEKFSARQIALNMKKVRQYRVGGCKRKISLRCYNSFSLIDPPLVLLWSEFRIQEERISCLLLWKLRQEVNHFQYLLLLCIPISGVLFMNSHGDEAVRMLNVETLERYLFDNFVYGKKNKAWVLHICGLSKRALGSPVNPLMCQVRIIIDNWRACQVAYLLQDNDFPYHYFNFAAFNELNARLEKKNPILTDYIGYVHNVEKVKEYGGATSNRVKVRNIGIRNLNNNVVLFTLWNEDADNFEEDEYAQMKQPVILAVSSCYLKRYAGQIQLSATSATRYYFNPDVQETGELLAA
ncbi:Dynein light chain, type 1/2 [Artemisia annua]|uniref:Dynein light chain, type 1/2 n=1 Tax=Artemisia annua TaxID=35608 RepID=A0A2U1L2P2_ARTAN|nr:Dynein light chain, type 1/2 [Artemisia annua]